MELAILIIFIIVCVICIAQGVIIFALYESMAIREKRLLKIWDELKEACKLARPTKLPAKLYAASRYNELDSFIARDIERSKQNGKTNEIPARETEDTAAKESGVSGN